MLTNKYAEGYPGRRYYGGCEYVDVAEQLAIDRAKALFGAEYANVQPHSGAHGQRRRAARAIATPGDKILGLELAHGGHLTHGMKLNFSGKLYNVAAYGVDPETFRVDMDERARAGPRATSRRSSSPAGRPTRASSTSPRSARSPTRSAPCSGSTWRTSPASSPPGCTRARCRTPTSSSSTVHKTHRRPALGLHPRQRQECAKKLNSTVFPGQQGGPLMHVIAAKAVGVQDRRRPPEFKERQERIARGRPDPRRAPHRSRRRRRPASPSSPAAPTCTWCSSTCATPQLDGQQAEDLLHEVGITVNRNAVPFDPRPPMVTSGLRIGTPGARHPRLRRRRVHRGRRHHRHRAARPGRTTSRRCGPRRRSSPPPSRCTRGTEQW